MSVLPVQHRVAQQHGFQGDSHFGQAVEREVVEIEGAHCGFRRQAETVYNNSAVVKIHGRHRIMSGDGCRRMGARGVHFK
jgi:hypothetical protein